MNQAIKLGQYSSQSSKFSSLSELLLLFSISRRQRAAATGRRLLQVAAGKDHPKQPNNLHDMDHKRIKSSDHDVNNNMSVMDSFGLKYATRCDDEGFGGVYGGKEECNNEAGVMEESFGSKYTTKCDDEGFGGVYGGKEECNNEAGVMEESFGSKYTTKCDDEGFGGIYESQEESSRSVMEESFGSKYTTKCNDEGFGGIYGSSNEESNTEIKINKDPAHHGSNNGSEVKEKEHAQNRTQVTKKA